MVQPHSVGQTEARSRMAGPDSRVWEADDTPPDRLAVTFPIKQDVASPGSRCFPLEEGARFSLQDFGVSVLGWAQTSIKMSMTLAS